MLAALLAALVGTFGYGVGSVLQAAGARRATALAVLRQPLYLAGLVCDGIAWLASLLALRRLPLFAVQSLLAGSLAVTVVLAALVLGARLSRRDVLLVAVVVLALGVLAGAAGEQVARQPPDGFAVGLLGCLAVLAVVAVLTYRRGSSLGQALLGGLAFSGAALAARGAHGADGLVGLLLQPLALAVAGFGALGLVLYARALETGAVGPATAVLWVVEVAVPAVVGVAVLDDGVRRGWGPAAVAGVLVALAACAALARDTDPVAAWSRDA